MADAVAVPVAQGGSGACGSAGGSPGGKEKVAVDSKRTLVEKIEALKLEQKRQREERKRVGKDLKKSVRQKQRLQKQAQGLSNDDLLAVIVLREAQARKEGTGAKSSGQAEAKKMRQEAVDAPVAPTAEPLAAEGASEASGGAASAEE